MLPVAEDPTEQNVSCDMSLSVFAKLAISTLLFVIVSLPAPAQDIDADFESEFPEEHLPYVGLGAGMTATFIFMDLTELNALARGFDVDEFGGPLSVYGGGVILTPIFIPNIRVAAHAFGGYHRSSRPKLIGGVEYNRTLRFGIRFQGSAGVEYAFPISGRFTILPSLTAGWGSYALEFTQSRAEQVEFREAWDPSNFGTDSAAVMSNHNRAVRMLNYHAFIYPTLHFEYALTGSFMVRASAGYHLGLIDADWTNESDTEYMNVPSINANGAAVQIGVFVGLFQQ